MQSSADVETCKEFVMKEFVDDQKVNIQHRLLSYPFEHYHWLGDNFIQGCCRLAVLLFIKTVL
jgi:hypothetical protein